MPLLPTNTPLSTPILTIYGSKITVEAGLEALLMEKNNGNLVVTGHRFSYTSPYSTALYHLDKVSEGDYVELLQNGLLKKYLVTTIFEVEAEDIWIEEGSEREIITIYTCTPIWTTWRRLVVRGELVRINQTI